MYRDVDFNDFTSEKNRKQHLVNLMNLCMIMDECTKFGDSEGVERSHTAIAEYMATIRDRDPKFAEEAPELYKKVMAKAARADRHEK